MEAVISGAVAGFQTRLEKVEIDGNADLEERFGTQVPVLFINGRKAFKYRCTARELRQRLSREVGARWPFRKTTAAS
jgi:hypothetical protein